MLVVMGDDGTESADVVIGSAVVISIGRRGGYTTCVTTLSALGDFRT